MKTLVLFYSTYGHSYQMAKAVAEGAGQVDGCKVDIKRVPETLPEDVLKGMGAHEAQKAFDKVPAQHLVGLRDHDLQSRRGGYRDLVGDRC